MSTAPVDEVDVVASPHGRVVGWVVGALAVALAVLALVLQVGGGRPQPVPDGLPDAGALVGWGLPVVRLLADLAAIATLGWLLAAAFLLPAKDGALLGVRLSGLRLAAWAALAWALAAAVEIVFSAADILGSPLSQVADPTTLVSFVGQVAQGKALLEQVLLALAVSLGATLTRTPRGAAWLLALSLVALAPPLLTGHSAASGGHDLAVSSLLIHVAAASVWVGGLAALAWAATAGSTGLRLAIPRFSTLALWCVATLAVSGVVNAWVRLGTPSALVRSSYGALVLAKATALVVLAAFGWAHRRRTLVNLTNGTLRAFLSLAAAELIVMAATVGLAVGLSRTPTPAATSLYTDRVSVELGYPLPAAPTLGRLLGGWLPDGFALAFLGFAASLYVAGVLAMRRRGDSWPLGRTVAWFAGLLLFGWATVGGLGEYANVMFSAHMGTHMLLAMLVPILLVIAAPMTLALRTLPGPRVPGEPGPRQLLLGLLHSRVAQALTSPLVAWAIFVGSFYAIYFSGIFPALMSSHLGHVLMTFHFLFSGWLFFYVVLAVDPSPRRLSPMMRLAVLFLAVPFHAFFSVALMSSSSPVAASFYRSLHRPYATDLLADQRLGAGLSWAFGELPIAIVLGIAFVSWVRADQREARRLDRVADRAEAAHRPTPVR